MGATLITPSKGRVATIIVAASNASARSIQGADFVCSGASDQNTIASAVNALPANGGRIVFTEGLFTFSAHYSLVNSNIIFSGQGPSTIFQCSTSDFIFSQATTAFSNITFENILFVGPVNNTVSVPTQARTTSGPGATTAIWIDGSLDTTGGPVVTNITIRNCFFRNLTSLPIRLFGITGVTSVIGCEFTNTKDVGFGYDQEVICSNNHSYMSADNGFSISRNCTKITCTGNTAELAEGDGIWLSGFIVNSNSSDYGPSDFSCVGNTVKNVGQNGIRVYDGSLYGIISGNLIDKGYNRGASDQLTDVECNGIAIGGYPSNGLSSPTFYTKQITITGNTIRTAPRSGIYVKGGVQGVKIANNHIYDVGTQFYANGSTLIGTNLAGMTNPQNVGILVDNPATVTDVYIENNTVIDQRGTPYCITAVYPYAPLTGVTMVNNVQNGCQNGPKLPSIITSEMIGISTAGSETMPRWAASNLTNITMSNGTLRFSYFRARKNETISNIKVSSGTTAAGATPTLVRFGLYSVDSSGNLTLLQGTTNDTAVFASTLTDYTKAITAVTLVQGQIYAIGVIVMTGAAAPTVCGVICSTPNNNTNDPRLTAVLTGQTDLVSSATVGSLNTTGSFFYAQVL